MTSIFDTLDELTAPATPSIQSFGVASIAVRKPGKTEWFMTSTEHNPKAFYLFTEDATKKVYLMMPAVANDPIVAKVCRQSLLYVCINRDGDVFISPVGTSDNDY